ncbi:MAG: VCBS repeat-containing protein, partial [Planctomycetales bacterium]|nr:VCBS repeat-containing protein [Planctomycetales bacterium]
MLRNQSERDRCRRELCNSLKLERLECRRLLTQLIDLDGDSDLDGVAAGAWFENSDGAGAFVRHELPNTDQVIAFDVDSDGDADLVTTPLRWYRNDGAGSFTEVEIPNGLSLTVDRLVATDVGQDGVMDVLAFNGDQVTLLRNLGGEQGLQIEVTLSAPGLVDAGDIEGDNDLDLLTTVAGQHFVQWNSAGALTPELVLETITFEDSGNQISFRQLQLIDLNGDRTLDLAATQYDYVAFDSVEIPTKVWKTLSPTATELAEIQADCSLDVDNASHSYNLQDINGDGAPDSWCTSSEELLQIIVPALNDGNGTFTALPRIDLVQVPNGPVVQANWDASAVGDINGDSIADFASESLVESKLEWIDGATGRPYVPPTAALFESQPIRFGESQDHIDVAVAYLDSDVYWEAVLSTADGIEVWQLDYADGQVTPNRSQVLPLAGAHRLEIGDVDKDGDQDVLVATTAGTAVLRNDGLGTLAVSGPLVPTGSAVDIALGDMDADGDLDFIVARGADENGAGQSNTVWLNNSEGNFVDSGRRLGRENSASAEVFDVDDDGDLDIVFGNLGGYNETWLNASNATFTLKSQDSFDRQDDTYHVALADFGGSAFNYFEANSFPDPSRHGSQNLSASEARRAAIGDLNRDGKFDVILATVGNQANQVWLLTSPSELTQRTADNFSRDSSNGVALADLDYDGDLDVIFANAGENSIYLQVGSPGGSADKLLPPRPVPRGDDFGNIRAEAKTLAAPIEGQSVSQAGRINFDGDVDVFLLPLIAGHQYEIDTDSTTVSVRVDDPVDRKVSGYTVFTAERSGTYAVQVSGRVGNYTLTAKLADNDHGASKRSATPLPFASSQTGVLVYGSLDETDYFSVDKIMNTSIQIVIDSPQAHLINARLAYSAGASVANADVMSPTRL